MSSATIEAQAPQGEAINVPTIVNHETFVNEGLGHINKLAEWAQDYGQIRGSYELARSALERAGLSETVEGREAEILAQMDRLETNLESPTFVDDFYAEKKKLIEFHQSETVATTRLDWRDAKVAFDNAEKGLDVAFAGVVSAARNSSLPPRK